MSNNTATITEAAPTLAQIKPQPYLKRLRWFEVSLVLLVAFGTPFLHSLYILRNGPSAMPYMSNAKWFIGIVQEVTGLLLLGYVLSRRNLRFKDLGLRWSLRDVGVGPVITGASFGMYAIGYLFVHFLHNAMFSSAARSSTAINLFVHPSIGAIPFSLLNPFFEELIVRAYLMNEVMELTGSSALAVAVSVAVQFSYHLYYGWEAAIVLSFPFLTLALYYARSRRALPVIVAHGFFDIYPLLRLWSG